MDLFSMSASDNRAKPALWHFVLYFLRLGAPGFGGPVALADHMRRDLVDARGWLTAEEYENGLALAAACPGPLAYQLAVYCGYVRFGVTGGLAVAVAFGLAPFSIVTFAAWLYVRFAGNWQKNLIIVLARMLTGCATHQPVTPTAWTAATEILGNRDHGQYDRLRPTETKERDATPVTI